MVLIGVPIFLALFLYPYLFGLSSLIDCKIMLEVLVIVCAYVELHEIESHYH